MPIYEYRCRECGEESEVLVRSRDAAEPVCPNCASERMERKLSAFATVTAGGDAEPMCSGEPGACPRCAGADPAWN